MPPTNVSPRAPFGPSLVLAAGIPFGPIATVLQKSAAVSKETYGHQQLTNTSNTRQWHAHFLFLGQFRDLLSGP